MMGDTMEDETHSGIGIAYTMDNVTVAVNAGSATTGTTMGENDPFTAAVETDLAESKANGAGLAMAYDLGGGAALQAGIGGGKDDGEKKNSWSLGLAFSF